jgi:hypothetical protein
MRVKSPVGFSNRFLGGYQRRQVRSFLLRQLAFVVPIHQLFETLIGLIRQTKHGNVPHFTPWFCRNTTQLGSISRKNLA